MKAVATSVPPESEPTRISRRDLAVDPVPRAVGQGRAGDEQELPAAQVEMGSGFHSRTFDRGQDCRTSTEECRTLLGDDY